MSRPVLLFTLLTSALFVAPTRGDILTEAHELLFQGKVSEVFAKIDAALSSEEAGREKADNRWADLAFFKMNLLIALNRASEADELLVTLRGVRTDAETQLAAKVLLAAGTMRGGNPQAAAEALDAVMQKAKNPEVLAAATIYKGQALLELKDWENALLCFLQVPVLYPAQKGWAPESILGIGRAHFGLDDFPKARASFRDLVRNYSTTPAAASAKAQLDLVTKREKALSGAR